ncbi:unnamed protein product [Allacma fusca]|uniref:Lipase domain-containing protein n=1 Tax=Allacma fusca TaxID=39272 RepID=A0A8J2PAQ3_9HEXA|nr:unnamed protein product [Allacma fusca]
MRRNRRGNITYPTVMKIKDLNNLNNTITVHMETNPGRTITPDSATSYYLAKKGQAPVKIDLVNLQPSNGDITPNETWYFGVHGWTGSYKFTPLVPELVTEIHNHGPANVILVDWEDGASNLYYPTAVQSAKLVGSKVADVINNLVKAGIAQPNKVHLIGFSLGGHVVGFIGKSLYSKYNWKPKKITSIDPAGPMYDDNPSDDRLDSKDGEYVEVFHTCGDQLGFWKPVGHVDIYVNRGLSSQPPCGLLDDVGGSCSHQFGKTVYGKYTHLQMKAYKCKSFHDFTKGRCGDDINQACEVGFKYSQCSEGVYHLNTELYFK